jgi:hypothetical protein
MKENRQDTDTRTDANATQHLLSCATAIGGTALHHGEHDTFLPRVRL